MHLSLSFPQTLLWLGNVCLLAVFALAGIAKLRDNARTREGLIGFGLPDRWAGSLAAVLVCAELLIAALLIYPPAQQIGAFAALGILIIFTLAITLQLARGRRPTCACFGSLTQSAISWKSVGRNVLLMAVAVALIAFPEAAVAPMPFDLTSLPMLSALTWFAMSAAWFLLLTRQNGRLILRIEQLEQRLHIVATTEPQSVPLPRLPELAGRPAPALTLRDVTSRRFDLQSLRGRPTVLLFLDATCQHCRPLLKRLSTWHSTSQVIVILAGQQQRAMNFAPGIAVVTDEVPGAMQAFGVFSTPTAIAIGADGTVAEPPARGNTAVGQLLDRWAEQPQQTEAQHEFATV